MSKERQVGTAVTGGVHDAVGQPRGHSAEARSKLRAEGRCGVREAKKVRGCRAGAAASANN